MKELKEHKLLEAAAAVRENAYAPYSGFAVGAALLTDSGRVFVGCNVENGAFAPSLCAERAAVAAAVAAGEREFAAIAVIADGSDYCYPCGVCRQVLSEFCDDAFVIFAAKTVRDFKVYRLEELLPHGFFLNKDGE